MGWLIERRSPGKGLQYMAMYRDLQGRQRSAGTFTSKRNARDASRDAESKQAAGRVGDPKRGRQSFRTYVEGEWLPNHVIEETTREGYVYLLNKHIYPAFGGRAMREILPIDIRTWVLDMQEKGAKPPTISNCKVVLDAILTTALNDQIVYLHAGKGVKTPPVARKPKRIITAEQFQQIHAALPDDAMRLLVETDIESGLRWGELTELRVKDLDIKTGVVTVARVVVHLKSKARATDARFVVKQYPKDKEWRQVKLARHVVDKLLKHIETQGLDAEDLLFSMPAPAGPARRLRPATLPDPTTLGLTEPNEKGRQYPHGTLTAYQAGKCRCQHCKDAVAAYRAHRRSAGKDAPRPLRRVNTDGHIPGDWFRVQVWAPALKTAELGFHVTPHGLRHAHASWLLAGGANLQMVKERLGHGSIATTELYLHALPDAQDEALTALDAIRGAKRTDSDSASQTVATRGPNTPDEELTELRVMVGKLTELIGSLGTVQASVE